MFPHMKQNLNAEIIRSIQDFRFPKYHEIPDVGLFLEQVAKYISSFLEPLGDITVTGSMISNYVKKGLVDNPIKKQYYRDQIAYLIFISMAKSVLSLEDIQLFIEIQKKTYDSKTAYEYFCREFEKVLLSQSGMGEPLAPLEEGATDEKVMLRNTSITLAHKIYLDKYFAKLHEKN